MVDVIDIVSSKPESYWLSRDGHADELSALEEAYETLKSFKEGERHFTNKDGFNRLLDERKDRVEKLLMKVVENGYINEPTVLEAAEEVGHSNVIEKRKKDFEGLIVYQLTLCDAELSLSSDRSNYNSRRLTPPEEDKLGVIYQWMQIAKSCCIKNDYIFHLGEKFNIQLP